MFSKSEAKILLKAAAIIESKVLRTEVLSSPAQTANYCQYRLTPYEHEVFAILFLNSHNQLIEFVEMSRGAIDGANVYPREVVKETLKYNAAAVIFTHKHPSGVTEPSKADEQITKRRCPPSMCVCLTT